jgi:hypothetical protein
MRDIGGGETGPVTKATMRCLVNVCGSPFSRRSRPSFSSHPRSRVLSSAETHEATAGLRVAFISTCVLEHFFEYHFDSFIARVEDAALVDPLSADTVAGCWKFGQAAEPTRAEPASYMVRGPDRHHLFNPTNGVRRARLKPL